MPPSVIVDNGLPQITAGKVRVSINKKQLSQQGGKSPERRRPVARPKRSQQRSPQRFLPIKHSKLSDKEFLKAQLEELKSGEKPKDKQVLSQELLQAGFVNSFVEFFHLTHRDDDQLRMPMTIDELEFIKKCLMDSETAHRQNNAENMYVAYKKIANHFAGRDDPTTAIYFFEKCLEIAEMMKNPKREGESNHYLGLMFEKLHDIPAAIRFHDLQLAVAREANDEEGVMLAGQHLTQIYRIQAEEQQDAGKLHESLDTLSRCLEAALASEDRKAEGYANYKLGTTLTALDDAGNSIMYLENFLRISRQIQDRIGECDAEAALGRASRCLHENAKAIRHFEAYLDIATENNSKEAQQKAFGELGSIYCELEDYDKAIHYYERNYQLTRTGSHQELDHARICLGMARGDFSLLNYIKTMSTDIHALIQWQCTRTPFNNEPQ